MSADFTPLLLDSKNTNWFALNDTESKGLVGDALTQSIQAQGSNYTQTGFNPTAWIPAQVPGTVLNTVLRNQDWLDGNLKDKSKAKTDFYDPYFDENVDNIPDVGMEKNGLELYTYWFYTEVKLSASSELDRHSLNFRGINYSTDIFINGKAVTDPNPQGMFLRRQFDLNKYPSQDGVTRIAVRVVPPNPPGTTQKSGNGGSARDNIAQNVTMRYSVGWDWVFPMPDRCTGIWDQVSITHSKSLILQNPHVITKVMKDNTNTLEHPEIDIQLAVFNPTDAIVSGTVAYTLGEFTGSKKLEFNPGNNPVSFDKFDWPNAELWWPNGGNPEDPSLAPVLHALDLHVSLIDGTGVEQLSDAQSLKIGIREVTTNDDHKITVGPTGVSKSRQFLINGVPIFLKGGNWMGMDMLFRFGEQRYHDELRFHKEMNLNFVRVWGGGLIERPEFYSACDELGILVMQDFWFSGEMMPRMDEEYTRTFQACAEDTIKMLRNHPSLLFWCGANESEPPQEALNYLTENIEPKDSLDGTRILVPNSLDISGNSKISLGDGPYGIFHVRRYFDWLPEYTGMGTPHYWNNPFNPEIGSLGFTTEESMRQMVKSSAIDKVPIQNVIYPSEITKSPEANEVNYALQLHRFSQEFINYPDGDTVSDQVYTYGAPTNIAEYSDRAQLASYLHYKTLWEGYLTHMWDYYTGMIIWKSQNPFPGLRAQLYDWYLEQTGGYWGVKKACEPVHIHFNLIGYPSTKIFPLVLVNQTAQTLSNLRLNWELFGLNGILDKGNDVPLALEGAFAPGHTTSSAGDLNLETPLTKYSDNVYFVKLTLHQDGKNLSENFYWLSEDGEFNQLSDYSAMPLDISAKSLTQDSDEYTIQVQLKNNDTKVAFWNRLQMRRPTSTSAIEQEPPIDSRILPVFYDDNYVSLMAGEEKTITISFRKDQLQQGELPELWMKSWNEDWRKLPVVF